MEQVFRLQIVKGWATPFLLGLLLSISAFANPPTEEFVRRTREVQDKLETAYAVTGTMPNYSMYMVVAAIDDAMLLLRDTTLIPVPEEMSADDKLKHQQLKEKVYEEVIWGEEGNDNRGSLARLIYSSLIHHGAYDPKDTYDGKTSTLENFKHGFFQVLSSLQSVVPTRDSRGKWILVGVSNSRREKVARNLVVRLFDILEYGNKYEKNDESYGYLADQLQKVAKEGLDLRSERLVGENAALAFYGIMMGLNLIHPQILPGVPFDFMGWITDSAWGSPLVSGAFLFTGYTLALGNQLRTKTKKTYDMLKILVSTLVDPGLAIKGLREGDEAYEAARKQAIAAQGAIKDEVRGGKGALGKHRAKMMAAGYDPDKPGLFKSFKESCEVVLNQLFK